jgi:hypothetical protein
MIFRENVGRATEKTKWHRENMNNEVCTRNTTDMLMHISVEVREIYNR